MYCWHRWSTAQQIPRHGCVSLKTLVGMRPLGPTEFGSDALYAVYVVIVSSGSHLGNANAQSCSSRKADVRTSVFSNMAKNCARVEMKRSYGVVDYDNQSINPYPQSKGTHLKLESSKTHCRVRVLRPNYFRIGEELQGLSLPYPILIM